ncbi:tRNA synthetases class I, catalytic domain-containing protein [Talaromyces proteolyticus]|uniref:glutamine--tRNA ligase n=1 Tax=Talaromyces proteolyticus TaxID=1131652 RepID=A0AAD4KGM4_9EURO|nr:tRNA synthetases class I, catalytic domain-containing protein [Talaromyces proteolyticus]KAH8689067.1 tRNA synthetases class I, catalytic domain-containing protein [Talaromyces proteolyticus]
MADAVAESVAKLQLDEETGEMVSKSELKKRMQKRAKKAAKTAAAASSVQQEKANKPASKPAKVEEPTLDPDAMFKLGFLADVYKLRPSKDVVTRFPPEPNGYLHLGHSKAIAINFGFARYHGGKTILRFDDTNPDAEKEEYFIAIEETIRWLGFTPSKITYASDNYQRMYDLAEKMIKMEKAYVCHCNEAETKLQRGGEEGSSPRYRCEHANQDVETNLKKFRGMRDGEYAPQTAWLRMKQDIINNPNPQMWDIAAYRIPKDQEPHFRTGTKWRVYPTYDFAHCLCDSFEGITHSLCTTEFIMSRESYEWLNELLVEFQPMQREYGRLNLSGTIMSKRGLRSLIENKIVRGWDDPRLYTLKAIRRRGIPPGALLSFISELGVTTSTSVIDIKRFEQSIRRYLERTVPRLMVVLDPVPVVIEDAEEQDVDVPFSPKDPSMGSHKLRLTKTVYIDRSDFREVDSKDYFRLAPGKTVGLLQMPYPIKAVSFTKDETTGAVQEIRAVFDKEGKRPKTYIQWVPEGSPTAEVRIHARLFKSDQPASVPGGFMNDINPDSETIWPNAMIETGFYEVKRRAPWPEAEGEKAGEVGPESVRFQGIRVAYFALDSDSTEDKIVLNRIVGLKEDSGKS